MFFLLLGALFSPDPARAQTEGSNATGGVALPPAPDALPPILVGEVHVTVVAPVGNRALCPENSACIFHSGGGIGGVLERRWPRGWALQLGYDAWFMDGSGIYELGVMHALRTGFRYVGRRNYLTHPYFGVGACAIIFGDSFRNESVGGGLHLEIGVEVEISHTLAVSFAATGRMFTMSEFRTRNDDRLRAEGFDLIGALGLQVGLTIFESE